MSFPGTGKIWMNGKLVDWNNAMIHVASHVVHYGSAVFEGARCYDTKQGPACFRLDAHMRRLYDSARIYRMEIPYDVQTLTDAVIDLIRVNDFRARSEEHTSELQSLIQIGRASCRERV